MENARVEMSPRHFGYLVIFNLVFAVSLIVVKLGMSYMDPMLFSGLRFMVYAAVLTPFCKWHPGRMRTLFAISMTGGAVSFGLVYMGIQIAGDLSSIVIALQLGVPFTTIFAMIFLGEQIHWRRWLGMALAFSGVMVVMFDPRVFTYITGILFGVVGALVGSSCSILMRKARDMDVFDMQFWIAMFSWPVLIVMSILVEGNPVTAVMQADWRVWPAIAFTALASNLIAHAGMFFLLQRYEASLLAPLGLLTPIFTIVLGVTFLGDELTTRMMIGALITLSGVLIISTRQSHLDEELIHLGEDTDDDSPSP